jgi:hypothetical protein
MAPYRIEWLDEARADVRGLDQPIAMRLYEGILRFARTGSGDVNALHGDMAGAFRYGLATTASCSHCRMTPCASSASGIAAKRIAE